MPDILRKTKDTTASDESDTGDELKSMKQRQNSEKARQNGTHPDTQQDKNKSKTKYKDKDGNALVKGSRSYPEDLMMGGDVRDRSGEVDKGVKQRQRRTKNSCAS